MLELLKKVHLFCELLAQSDVVGLHAPLAQGRIT